MSDTTLSAFDALRSQARIRAALDGIITIDAAGVVAEWNPAAERIFGYAAADAIGRSMGDLIVPDHMRDAHRAGMEHYLETGEGPALDQRLEMPAMTADGRDITIELTITAFEVGGEHWFTGWARDITEQKAIETELARERQRFEAIVEHSSDVITVIGPSGEWLYTSQSGTRLTGYPKGFDPAGGIFSLLHPDDVAVSQQALSEIVQGTRGPEDPVELRIVTADGSVRWFETTGVNMIDNPAVGGVVLHARDVTDTRQIEHDLVVRTRQIGGILHNLQMGVLVENEERRVAIVNDAFARMFATPVAPTEMVGADCAELADAAKHAFADPEAFVRGVQRCLDGRSVVTDEELEMADGRVLQRDYVPVLERDVVRSHIWIYRDVSDRKRIEAERERMLDAERQARRSIEAAQAQLEEQNRSLRELDSLKNELVATVSHELRTPLTSIVSFSELLDDGTAGPLGETQSTFVGTIRRNADRLIRLVDDLLLLARLESHALHLDSTAMRLDQVAEDIVASHRPAAAANGITIALDAPEGLVCLGDPTRIAQVVDNLVSNAVKFSAEGGEVRVELETVNETDGAAWRLTVADSGIGIPAAELDRLFQRFFRASNARTAMVRGTGLGLAVTEAIVRLHGGTIAVESVEDKGTTFTVTVPCATEVDDA